MRKKTKTEENEDQVISEMKELYQNKLNEKEALKNLLIAIEKGNTQDELSKTKKSTSQK